MRPDDYDVLAPFFDPIVMGCHKKGGAGKTHASSWDLRSIAALPVRYSHMLHARRVWCAESVRASEHTSPVAHTYLTRHFVSAEPKSAL